jgi:glucose-1-phosphate cytidylyltransferase
MEVVILCGGQGTRAYPYTQTIPKALMEIDGVPIVEHVMRIYAAHGLRQFVLACGHLSEVIINYVRGRRFDWDVCCVDTGASADTGDRVHRVRDLLGPTFHVTYCDGLGLIEVTAALEFHRQHGCLATVTGAPLRSQYGIVRTSEGDRVDGFDEKPILPDYWINGGFFTFEHRVFDQWEGHSLERDVLPALAARGELRMFRHRGFWRSMDTYKDQQELNGLWPSYSEKLLERLGLAREQAAPAGVLATGKR